MPTCSWNVDHWPGGSGHAAGQARSPGPGFQNSSPGALLNALISDIGAGLFWVIKPWRANLTASRYFVGVGAFNMVGPKLIARSAATRSIRLQVIDDLFLGKIIKRGGFSQDCLLARNM